MRPRLGHGVGVDLAAALRPVHAAHGKPVLAGELEVALVVRGHAHDRSGSVVGQHEVGEPHRDLLSRGRVLGNGSRVEALFLGALGLSLQARFPAHPVDERLDLGPLRRRLGQARHGRVLRRQGQERRAVERVGPRREHGQRLAELREPEQDLRPLRAPDPVSLHRLHALGPVLQSVQAVEQALGVVGHAEEPLRQVADGDEVSGALAPAVDHLLVGEHGPAAGAPVDGRRLAVGQPALPHPEKQPLVPPVVPRIAGGQLLGPVVEAAQGKQLLLHPRDVPERVLARVDAALDRRVLRWQAEGIPAHRVQGLAPRHPLPAVERVAQDVVAPVPDVEPAPRRVRIHVQHVELVAGNRGVDIGHPLLGPRALPLPLDLAGGVLVGHAGGNIAEGGIPYCAPPIGRTRSVASGRRRTG